MENVLVNAADDTHLRYGLMSIALGKTSPEGLITCYKIWSLFVSLYRVYLDYESDSFTLI
jgi:hypothetical protein